MLHVIIKIVFFFNTEEQLNKNFIALNIQFVPEKSQKSFGQTWTPKFDNSVYN